MKQGEYDFVRIEKYWREHWLKEKTFKTLGPGDLEFDPDRPKFYVLDMFPYTSGSGLHIGHPKGYIATDVYSRFKRLRGFNVLHPMGFDSFGLPAEQYAIEHNVHPEVVTEKNIETMRMQLQFLGLSYDWDRELATSHQDYYCWTQWIFLKLFDSWFDSKMVWTDNSGRLLKGRVRPISELVEVFKTKDRNLSNNDIQTLGKEPGIDWIDLTNVQKQLVLNNYRLAYQTEANVNWCPGLGTVLSNEEVTNKGTSERGDFPVFQRPLKQWVMRITALANRLLNDLNSSQLPDGSGGTYCLEWPESVKAMQQNWIGRSEGANVIFKILNGEAEEINRNLTVFTTRPDTIFGVTFIVVSPKHPLVIKGKKCLIPEYWPKGIPESWKGQQPGLKPKSAITAFASQTEQLNLYGKEEKKKTGIFSGIFALNPVNGQKLPIFISDYVSMDYGSGAIMAVPAHDERDYAFANQYGLEIVKVIDPPEKFSKACYTGFGRSINSSSHYASFTISGLSTLEAKTKIIRALEEVGCGSEAVNYRLRDWIFSRQRYWGEPFPLATAADGNSLSVDIPVLLPQMEEFQPQIYDNPQAPIQPPLARADSSWRQVEIDGVLFEREYNVMPQWAGSCWYYLRFIDPHNVDHFCDFETQKYFMPVDLYVGGAEHAVLHLLYARFWHKVLFDLGYVTCPEPFKRLFNQGMITADAFMDDRGAYVDIREVEIRNGNGYHQKTGLNLKRFSGKMGKRYKNGLPPEEVGKAYGVDALRLYEMYMGPLDASAPWNMDGIRGMQRFLQRVWRNLIRPNGNLNIGGEMTLEMKKLMHKTIIRISEDVEALRFNTAIAALIELNNVILKLNNIPKKLARTFLIMLSPFAPHIAEEIWQIAGWEPKGISKAEWPIGDKNLARSEVLEIPVQVNGKIRARFEVEADTSSDLVEKLALQQPNVTAHLKGSVPKKIIVIPNRLVNIVTGA